MDKLKILVVDDKQVIGDLFEFTLGYSGHIITVVNSAFEAVERIKSEKFDIAFVDIVMPERDGVELLEDIKKVAPQLPVVMMSGYSVEDKREKSKKLGAITCLKKPFEIEDVKKIIKSTLGRDV
ncbi:MAG: hypothetical protein A2Z88_03820 [Omnitrophica WOR_2 bacterium GWA2_47_8]|nr:MAG: hypothetical protein A2Z88_03820 [Omnitrophica WOR_2 bacterium GWA2_47_8]